MESTFRATAIVVAGLLSASDYDSSPPTCDALTITVAHGPRPVFSWTPTCPVTEITVSMVGPSARVWVLTAALPQDSIVPPVTYGVGQEGTMATTPPDTLFPTGTYEVTLIRSDATGLFTQVGRAAFKP
jgi:hypothetical protein